MKRRRMYMHTLNRQPATFNGEQVVFADVLPPQGRGRAVTVTLCRDLRALKREQARSRAWRASMGFGPHAIYGYVIVRVPARTGEAGNG